MSASFTNRSSPPNIINDVLLCFLAGGDDILSFNTLADGTLQLLSLVQYPPFPTHHQLKNATPTLTQGIVILLVRINACKRSVAWLGATLVQKWLAKPPPRCPPLQPRSLCARARFLTNILSIFCSCDDPCWSPASLPGAGSHAERGKFPQKMTSFQLRCWARPPFPGVTVSGQ